MHHTLTIRRQGTHPLFPTAPAPAAGPRAPAVAGPTTETLPRPEPAPGNVAADRLRPAPAEREQVVIRTFRPADRLGVARLGVFPELAPARTNRAFPHDDRLWVAEHRGRIIGVIGLGYLDLHVAQVRYLAIDADHRTDDLAARLFKTVLHHCRHCGDLKLIVDARFDRRQAVTTCTDSGFQYARRRRRGGRATLEFYRNLYQKPPATAADTPPHARPARPPERRA